MNDLIPNVRTQGKILIDNQDVFQENIDIVALRKKVGMVFQRPQSFSHVHL